MSYYQSGGILACPRNIPLEIFEEEVNFYDLGPDVLSVLRENEGYIGKEDHVQKLPENYYQRKLWELFEIPDSSLKARIVMLWSMLAIILSVVVFCLESLPEYEGWKYHNASCKITIDTRECEYDYIDILEKA